MICGNILTCEQFLTGVLGIGASPRTFKQQCFVPVLELYFLVHFVDQGCKNSSSWGVGGWWRG